MNCFKLFYLRRAVDSYSELEQLGGFFRLFSRWWNCRSSFTEISANGASPGEGIVHVRYVQNTHSYKPFIHLQATCSQNVKYHLPSVAISYNKMPNDQLEKHTHTRTHAHQYLYWIMLPKTYFIINGDGRTHISLLWLAGLLTKSCGACHFFMLGSSLWVVPWFFLV